MTEAMTLTVDEAHALVAETLIRCRTAPATAAQVADALVAAELAGQAGHGLRRVPSYAGQALTGKVDGFASASATLPRPGLLAVDAAHGFAYPALELAMSRLPAMAAANGIAAAGVRRSHHAGVAGWFVERLAEQGLVAMMFANTPAAMAPWGGKVPLYGTNPIAFAAPTETAPVVIDLSLSTVARGKIMAAAQKGETIPADWATDADGNPTTDATAALKGTMQPAGGAKGAALALMVEILAASLTGAATATQATSFFDAEGAPPGTGQFLLAIEAAALGGPETAARIGALATAIDADPGARTPGRRRQTIAAERRAKGIPVDQDLLDSIARLGTE